MTKMRAYGRIFEVSTNASRRSLWLISATRIGRHRQVGQPESAVQFPIGQQPGVGGDATAVDLQLQATVETDPQGAVI
jgi:hypothetical protein